MKARLYFLLAASLLSGCAMYGIHNLPNEKKIELPPTRVGMPTSISYAHCVECWSLPYRDKSAQPALIINQHLNTALQAAGLPPMRKAGQRNDPGIHIASSLATKRTNDIVTLLSIFSAFIVPFISDNDYTLTTCLYENGTLKAVNQNKAHSLFEHFHFWPVIPILLSPIPKISADANQHYLLAGQITAGEIIATYADYTKQKPINPALSGACK